MNAPRGTAGLAPVTILAGYLGAGKTTLVNHLLRHAQNRRIAVLVNDFGDVCVDADLIVARDGDVMQIAGGCACCAIGGDFTAGVARLARNDVFDHIVVEASGVALPASMAAALSVLGEAAPAAVVVTADAETVRARSEDAYVGDVIRSQLRAANVLILNKADLCAPAELAALRAWAAECNPRALVIPAVRCAVEPVLVLADCERAESGLEPLAASVAAERLFASWTLELSGAVDAARVASDLASAGLERAKGILLDRALGWVVVQVVGSRWTVDPAAGPGAAAGRIACIRRRQPA